MTALPNFDLVGFLTAGVSNAPAVIFLVLALTYLAGQLGARGKAQTICAFVFGAVFGAGLQMATTGVPADFGGWFWVVVYAGLMGVLPSMTYDMLKEVVAKGLRAPGG